MNELKATAGWQGPTVHDQAPVRLSRPCFAEHSVDRRRLRRCLKRPSMVGRYPCIQKRRTPVCANPEDHRQPSMWVETRGDCCPRSSWHTQRSEWVSRMQMSCWVPWYYGGGRKKTVSHTPIRFAVLVREGWWCFVSWTAWHNWLLETAPCPTTFLFNCRTPIAARRSDFASGRTGRPFADCQMLLYFVIGRSS